MNSYLSLGNARETLYALLHHAYVGSEQLEALQTARFRRLIHHPYYSQLVDGQKLKFHYIGTVET